MQDPPPPGEGSSAGWLWSVEDCTDSLGCNWANLAVRCYSTNQGLRPVGDFALLTKACTVPPKSTRLMDVGYQPVGINPFTWPLLVSAQRDHRDAIQIAIGDVEFRLIRRQRHAVGISALVTWLRERGWQHRRDYGDGLDDRVRRGIDDIDRIRLVLDDVELRLRRIQASSCSAGRSP